MKSLHDEIGEVRALRRRARRAARRERLLCCVCGKHVNRARALYVYGSDLEVEPIHVPCKRKRDLQIMRLARAILLPPRPKDGRILDPPKGPELSRRQRGFMFGPDDLRPPPPPRPPGRVPRFLFEGLFDGK